MAGSYPDVPSRRMAWDADGTLLFSASRPFGSNDVTSILNELTPTAKAILNDETATATTEPIQSGPSFLFVVFPELREFDGMFGRELRSDGALRGVIERVESSPDTTNGIDGTWSTVFADYADPTTVQTDTWRTEIRSAAVNAIRAIRIQGHTQYDGQVSDARWRNLHIYGEISPGETPDKLIFIDEATGLEFTTAVDFGDLPRGGSEDFTFRIRNDSAALTANTIQYTATSLYLDSGAWYTFTLPGGATFQSTRQIASLAPATTSGLITGRRITPGDEQIGLHAARISAVTTSFS